MRHTGKLIFQMQYEKMYNENDGSDKDIQTYFKFLSGM